CYVFFFVFFFSSRRRHTRFSRDWSSDGALPIFLGNKISEVLKLVMISTPFFSISFLSASSTFLVTSSMFTREIDCSGSGDALARSEERRVGKECISRCAVAGGRELIKCR